MRQRVALLLAAVITGFAIVMVGAIIMVAAQPQQAALTSGSTTANAAAQQDPTATVDPLVQTLLDRETTYQQRLQDAEAQLRKANEMLQAYQNQAAAPTQTPAPVPASARAAPAAPTYAISADQAANIALSIAPGASLQAQPSLVNFQGAVAYEVTLDLGTVYVDANSGQVLYAVANNAPASGGRRGDDDGGQGGGDD